MSSADYELNSLLKVMTDSTPVGQFQPLGGKQR